MLKGIVIDPYNIHEHMQFTILYILLKAICIDQAIEGYSLDKMKCCYGSYCEWISSIVVMMNSRLFNSCVGDRIVKF